MTEAVVCSAWDSRIPFCPEDRLQRAEEAMLIR